jgi:pyrroloquinoline quinone biosynthesis protein D
MPSTEPTPMTSRTDRPRLAAHVRLTFDPARERHVLLTPESVTVLNGTGAAILGLCDGERTVTDIVRELRGRYDRVDDGQVRLFLDRLAARRCVQVGRGGADRGEAGRG